MEIWKDIEGYEGYYKISTCGRVKNTKSNAILTGDENSIGYKRVTLYTPVKKRFFVHRLVAYHFVDGYKDNLVVNHKDGNKRNNKFENLEWVTKSENDLHAFKLGLRKSYPCTFKHKVEMRDKITNRIVKVFENVEECAIELNVTRTNIYNCCNGKQKTCRGYVLRYA